MEHGRTDDRPGLRRSHERGEDGSIAGRPPGDRVCGCDGCPLRDAVGRSSPRSSRTPKTRPTTTCRTSTGTRSNRSCAEDPAKALKLAADGKIPMLLQFAARRVGAIGTPEALDLLAKSITEAKTDEQRVAYLRGLQEAAKGKRQRADADGLGRGVRGADEVARRGRAQPGAGARGHLRRQGRARHAPQGARRREGRRRGAARGADGARRCPRRRDRAAPAGRARRQGPARRGAPRAGRVRRRRRRRPRSSRSTAPSRSPRSATRSRTLAARVGFAKELMDAVAAKKIPVDRRSRRDRSRSFAAIRTRTLDKQIADLWGVVRDSPAERKKLIAEWKKQARPRRPRRAGDVNLGRAVFAKTCLNCHTLYARRRQGRPRDHRREPRQHRLPAREHPRPERGHPEGVRRDADRHHRRPHASSASSRAR